MRPAPTTQAGQGDHITTIEGFHKSADEAAMRAYRHRKASDWSILGITVLVTVIVAVIALA
jgi:hypothetical protein